METDPSPPIPTYYESINELPSTPSYSPEPTDGEERLYMNARIRSNLLPTGTYFQKSKSGNVTIVLRGQEDDALVPSYGRNAVISGSVNLDTRKAPINEVSIKLQGRMEVIVIDGTDVLETLVDNSFTLWTADDQSLDQSHAIPFSINFPTEYQQDGHAQNLPPTFEFSSPDPPCISVKVDYLLEVLVKKPRRLLQIWGLDDDNLKIPMNYYPRSRPTRPILQDHHLLSTIKSAPGEWFQSHTKLDLKSSLQSSDVFCDFFLPSSRIFAVTDDIPFHVQLSGLSSSLSEFLPPSYKEVSSISKGKRRSGTDWKEPKIRVYLVRQVLVHLDGHRTWSNVPIGEGEVMALPPTSSGEYSPETPEDVHLDWAGHLRCNDDVGVGGFAVGKVIVKDFIMLSISPLNSQKSGLAELRHPVSVRLVTDTWTDTTSREDRLEAMSHVPTVTQ